MHVLVLVFNPNKSVCLSLSKRWWSLPVCCQETQIAAEEKRLSAATEKAEAEFRQQVALETEAALSEQEKQMGLLLARLQVTPLLLLPQPTATGRNRPQPTATDRNRPQATATDRNRPQLTATDRNWPPREHRMCRMCAVVMHKIELLCVAVQYVRLMS